MVNRGKLQSTFQVSSERIQNTKDIERKLEYGAHQEAPEPPPTRLNPQAEPFVPQPLQFTFKKAPTLGAPAPLMQPETLSVSNPAEELDEEESHPIQDKGKERATVLTPEPLKDKHTAQVSESSVPPLHIDGTPALASVEGTKEA